MKLILSVFITLVSVFSMAQSNLTIFNNGGQQFYAILNGIKQNSQPQTNVYISGIKNGGYSLKIIFADGKTADVDKNLFIESPSDITTRITFKKGKGKLQLVSLVSTEGVITPGAVIYRPSDAAVYSDAVVLTTTVQSTTTQTTNGNSNTNAQVPTTNPNANFNMNVSGNGIDPNMQNGNVGISINVSGMDPNMQNGNMGVNMNVNATGLDQQVNPNANVNVNASGMTQTVTPSNNANINMNVNANGMNTQQTPGQTSITTTTTTTTTNSGGNVNYQTNNQQNQINTQANVNTSGAIIACNRTLNNLPTFLEELKDQRFEDDRIESVKLALNSTCLTTEQAGKIVELFTFDENKLEVAKFLSDRLMDRENATALVKLMTFDSNKMEFRKYVARH